MSIEAINWALKHAQIPTDRRDSSSLAVVLIGLANHADPEGRNAFPSLATLAEYTRLSERSVRYALRHLERLELIRSADPRIVAAHVQRADRRSNGYDLSMTAQPANTGGSVVDDRGQAVPMGNQRGGQNTIVRAAKSAAARGGQCPRTIHEPSLNHPRRRHAGRDEASYVPPPCGSCDARPGDPVSTRSTTDEDGNVRRCPYCHPAEIYRVPDEACPTSTFVPALFSRPARHPSGTPGRLNAALVDIDKSPPLATHASAGGPDDKQ
ncbi:helix-turn-helix domain-containing protein [Amycolatopsis silviterrae]|uniref:Helix-turn-helix domain-containing protein n=1 Tax=Amycolatopsis silviterrae TaxID=1656914 RepID=A0ABW5HK53_9PSEU